jgi:hypothetical protein
MAPFTSCLTLLQGSLLPTAPTVTRMLTSPPCLQFNRQFLPNLMHSYLGLSSRRRRQGFYLYEIRLGLTYFALLFAHTLECKIAFLEQVTELFVI